MNEVILGISARCRHDVINELNAQCALCDWENLLLKRKPPFNVRFIGNQGLTKDAIYKVIGMVTAGVMADGPIPGFLLADDEGDVFDCTFDMALFSTRLEP